MLFSRSFLGGLVTVSVLAALALAGAPAAQAQSPAITSISAPQVYTGFDTDETIGWRFQATQNQTVTALGWLDTVLTNPLVASHEVGIWNDTGSLLGSLTVQTSSALIGRFRYETLTTSLNLTAGQFYRIGGRDLTGDGDSYRSNVTDMTTSTLIVFDQSVVSEVGDGFTFPVRLDGTQGRFGPNFLSSIAVTAAPEPGTVAFMAMGLMGTAGMVIRRRKA